jgi:hypothetical protein
MAHAAGKPTRAAARSHVENPKRPQKASGALVPLANSYCADWHAGFQAGGHGEPYVHLLDCDDVSWRTGFMEGAGHRLRRLASIGVTPRFARPVWDLPR